MANAILIIGESGNGKSSSMRNHSDGENILVIQSIDKQLPFKNKITKIVSDNYEKIKEEMKKTSADIIVLDDVQYLMSNEFMRRATEKGYDKFSEIAQGFWDLVNSIKDLPANKRVYLLGHTQCDDRGTERFKTIGKLLDEKITIEGMFTIVLKAVVNDSRYCFTTQTNGSDTVKSPIGMFDSVLIENDLKYVDEKICNYYEIGDFKSDEEIKKEDEKKAVEGESEEKPKRRHRRSE